MKPMLFLALTFALLIPAPAEAKTPAANILGVSLEMTKSDVHAVLGRIGSLDREERKSQEIWHVRSDRFQSVILGYDKDGRVRYVTAVSRPDGRRMRYSDAGPTAAAQHHVAGKTHTYTWNVQPRGGEPFLVIAIGRDPRYLRYYSLKRPNV